MLRLAGSHFNSLSFCFAVLWLGCVNARVSQDLFAEADTPLWKSLQEEVKALEDAARRVNTLLNAHPPKKIEDQEAKPAENPADVTVLASPDSFKNGIRTNPVETKTDEKKEETIQKGPEYNGMKQQLFHNLTFGSLFDTLGFFKHFPEPWWKGKNVCVEKSEKEEENKVEDSKGLGKQLLIMGTGTFEHCKQTAGKYICTTVTSSPASTKTVSTTYQCCEGFRRQAEGCVPVELKDVVDVLDSKGSKDFATMLKSQNVMQTLTGQNITVFAPVDDAMRSLHIDFQESNQIRQIRRVRAVDESNINEASKEQARLSERDFVLSHIARALLDVDDFTNEMVVKSLHNDSPLRVNIYPGRQDAVLTVNCARILSWDNLASHARVHTIDRVLEPLTQSVIDILSQPQFSQFRQYLEQEGLIEKLANASAVTVFAPNNEAWDKLGDGLKDKYSRGEACIDKVLRHHILPLTLCAAPTSEGRLTTADIDGEMVRLFRDESNQLMVDEKGRVVQEDIVATNGVVHVLDKVLTPKSAKPLSELLLSTNHTSWLTLLDRAGLMDDLNKQENITVFVPTEQVLAEESTRKMLDSMDTDKLRQVLLYHVTEPTSTCEMVDRMEVPSQAGPKLHITMYYPFGRFSGLEPRPAVQCAPLAHTNGKACHVVAHEVTKLLLPPNSTVLQLIADNPQLSIVKSIIEGTQLERDIVDKTDLLADGFTLLAPSDDAFNKLDDDMVTNLLTDKKFADEVLRKHILKGSVCCASISSISWPLTMSFRTIDSSKIQVNRDVHNRVQFGRSATEKCDVLATDGLVHVIDTVLLPEVGSAKLGNVASGQIMLFGI